jgi:hypothetical protein
MSPAPESADLPVLIGVLSDPNPARREGAATELFRRGRELARSAAERWFADPDFAKNFALDAPPLPETTVGIAVTPESFTRIRAANGSPRLADVPPVEDAKEFELDFPYGVRLDILTTREPGGSGAIARYLQKFGEGIQQIELLARNIDAATEILSSRFRVQPIYPATRRGADGTRVNFFLASTADGTKVLIELVETLAANSC